MQEKIVKTAKSIAPSLNESLLIQILRTNMSLYNNDDFTRTVIELHYYIL
jgi:hypothetical protein